MSICDNVTAGLKLTGIKASREEKDDLIEECLTKAGLWNEVRDRLRDSALALSGGQQQRLCIARALAVDPEILLMDEPASALDPIATSKIEELIYELKDNYTIVIVTHNMQQAARVSDRTAFFMLGKLVEYGDTREIFMNPAQTTQSGRRAVSSAASARSHAARCGTTSRFPSASAASADRAAR